MALYSNSAFGAPFKTIKRLSTQIEPNYLFGSREYKTDNMLFSITNVAITSNVATLTVQLQSGGGPTNAAGLGLPIVGAKMGVRGTTSNGGVFNVDPATLTATTINAATGAGTLSFALTNANIAGTADTGTVVVQSAEVPDLVVSGSASAPFALVFTPDESDNSRCLGCQALWTGTIPTAAVVALQGSNIDDDARYMVIANTQGTLATIPGTAIAPSTSLAVIASSAVTQSGAFYSFIGIKFIRAKVMSMTGGDGTTGLILTVFA
jgi:hypothetical protein